MDEDESRLVRHIVYLSLIKIARFATTRHAVKLRGYVRALVDSTPPQRNMKSIDLLFTSDSFEHNACDVSVANLQSQYTFLYITLTCKEKEKREKEILVIPDRELCYTVNFVSTRSGWLMLFTSWI